MSMENPNGATSGSAGSISNLAAVSGVIGSL